MYEPYTSAQEKTGKDMLCFVFGLLSFLFCSCLMPLAPVFGVISLLIAFSFRRTGGRWSWQFCFGIALSVLGTLFGIFLTVLLIYSLVTKNPDSVYGMFLIFSK